MAIRQLSLDPEQNIEQQIIATLNGELVRRKLDPRERAMLGLLRHCKGPKSAIPISELAPKLRASERTVKATAKALIEDFNLPIGASRQEPYGYYLCVTADDIEQAARPIRNEILSLAKRYKALRGGARLIELLGQLRLDVENRSSL